jgi:hypothetical protein
MMRDKSFKLEEADVSRVEVSKVPKVAAPALLVFEKTVSGMSKQSGQAMQNAS